MKFVSWAALLMMPACMMPTCSKDQTPTASQPVDFAQHFSIASKFDESKNTLQVNVSLDKGFHAYAEGEKIGRPLSLSVDPKNGWAADGAAELPSGKRLNLGELGHSVVLEGEFALTQRLRPGNGDGHAVLSLQICTKTLCDKPRSHTVTWP